MSSLSPENFDRQMNMINKFTLSYGDLNEIYKAILAEIKGEEQKENELIARIIQTSNDFLPLTNLIVCYLSHGIIYHDTIQRILLLLKENNYPPNKELATVLCKFIWSYLRKWHYLISNNSDEYAILHITIPEIINGVINLCKLYKDVFDFYPTYNIIYKKLFLKLEYSKEYSELIHIINNGLNSLNSKEEVLEAYKGYIRNINHKYLEHLPLDDNKYIQQVSITENEDNLVVLFEIICKAISDGNLSKLMDKYADTFLDKTKKLNNFVDAIEKVRKIYPEVLTD